MGYAGPRVVSITAFTAKDMPVPGSVGTRRGLGPVLSSQGRSMATQGDLLPAWPRVSVVIPTLNEARNLRYVSGALPVHCPPVSMKS